MSVVSKSGGSSIVGSFGCCTPASARVFVLVSEWASSSVLSIAGVWRSCTSSSSSFLMPSFSLDDGTPVMSCRG
eukprot:13702402-Ditylum_brightwellii.AAC.1